ncbi:T9SS type B sorting domain-containing protein [Neolewinella antarctica]|uniref:Gliding motility-associated-like protein n=1 Tax=Neolewinella antarctica TaxID=442734 RepID=A0ABX0X8F6_9BACT|nr:gliding motility-associated C-terminal domain-containing protein [Neolewinella antarctica]NJC25273.1 gliding motility-associated-like protein [Neolewinella antarctica]
MKLVYTLFSLLLCSALSAQAFTTSVSATDANCRGNGAASVTTSGGSGNFRYQLSNVCGDFFPAQSRPNFTRLKGCDYVLITSDRLSGERDTSSFNIAANTTPLSVRTSFSGCDAVVTARGGQGPYVYDYSITNTGSFTITSPDALTLSDLGGEVASGVVFDQCGNSRTFSLNGRTVFVRGFTRVRTDTGVEVTAQTGVGPFTYTLTSSLGSFNNNNGFFSFDQIGCDPTVEIQGTCGNEPFIRPLNLDRRGDATLSCVNFFEGTATVSVGTGVNAPLTFRLNADGTIIESMDPVITGIPPGTQSVSLITEDACGNIIRGRSTYTPNQLTTPTPAQNCSDPTLELTVGRTCDSDASYPVIITCETCPGEPQVVLESKQQPAEFSEGMTIGRNRIVIEDDCGDRTTCRDTVVLELISTCDGIIANATQLFNCDNGTESRRLVKDPTHVFTLFDDTGQQIKVPNSSGLFTNLTSGTYTVKLSNSCTVTDLENTVELVGVTPFEPAITINPSYAKDINGECGLVYNILLNSNDGPFRIRSADDSSIDTLLLNFGVSECSFFAPPYVVSPGSYLITSLSRCGSKQIDLPDLVEQRIDSVTVNSVCPEGGTITVSAFRRTGEEWRDYFENLDLLTGITNGQSDYFVINGRVYRDSIITGLAPGDYTVGVGLGFGSAGCPIDTMSFTVPAYLPIEVAVLDNYLCEGTNEAQFSLTPQFGFGPYTISELDNDDRTQVLATYGVGEGVSLTLPSRQTGFASFVIEDACGVTSDFEVEVRDLAEQLAYSYTCEPTVRLFTDTLPGEFTWLDQDGTAVGQGNEIVVTPDSTDRIYTLNVTTDRCPLTADILVPGRNVLPSIDLSPTATDNIYLSCSSEGIQITAATDTFSNIFWTNATPVEQTTAELNTNQAGTYTARAVNDLGCITNLDISLEVDESPEPVIASAPDNCPGGVQKIGINSPTGATVNWNDGQRFSDTIVLANEGINTVVVTSEKGCVGVDTLEYVFPLPLGSTPVVDSVSCFGFADGAILVNATGGTGNLTFRYNNDNTFFNASEPLINLGPGTYSFVVQDENGCSSDSTTVIIVQPDSLRLEIGPDIDAQFGDLIDLPLITNATVISSANVTGLASEIDSVSRSLLFRAEVSTDLVVTITDELGCTAFDELSILVQQGRPIYAPTAFSPNNDGVNDFFTLQAKDREVVSIGLLQIYDRWGGLVYEQTGVNVNDIDAGWAGLNGSNQPVESGTYVWRARLTYFDESTLDLSGTVNVLR